MIEAQSRQAVEIRAATPDDAKSLLALKRVLDDETRFMLLEPDERTATAAEVAEDLRSVEHRRNSVVLVAADGDELVGYVEASGGTFRRNRHVAYVVIGVRRSHAGRGIGRRLLTKLERWACGAGVLRLELTVMTGNERAVSLYRSMAYRIEGTRRAALSLETELVDEYWMAKLLEPSPPHTV